MSSILAFYRRNADTTAESFARRLHDAAARLAAGPDATLVELFVDDGATGAPPEANAYGCRFDAALLVEGVSLAELPEADAAYDVRRRVIKARPRRTDGARSEGYTILCPSVRAPFLTHEQFDAHWRDNHSRVHVASSPGTCHYEQLVIDAALGDGAPDWDGVGLLSFATAADYVERLFDGEAGQRAIFEDAARFVVLDEGETLPASEFVYADRGRVNPTGG
jgi:hypothetical protein